MEDVPEVEDVVDVHQYIDQLWRMYDRSEKDNLFLDDYYFSVHTGLIEGLEALDLDIDASEFDRRLVFRDYAGAGELVEEANLEKDVLDLDEVSYRPPRVGDDPFEPSSSIQGYLWDY
ncbi:MAG: hypothetical protein R6V35_05740 [Candidatus Nanohaloarchaea archaeon]